MQLMRFIIMQTRRFYPVIAIIRKEKNIPIVRWKFRSCIVSTRRHTVPLKTRSRSNRPNRTQCRSRFCIAPRIVHCPRRILQMMIIQTRRSVRKTPLRRHRIIDIPTTTARTIAHKCWVADLFGVCFTRIVENIIRFNPFIKRPTTVNTPFFYHV